MPGPPLFNRPLCLPVVGFAVSPRPQPIKTQPVLWSTSQPAANPADQFSPASDSCVRHGAAAGHLRDAAKKNKMKEIKKDASSELDHGILTALATESQFSPPCRRLSFHFLETRGKMFLLSFFLWWRYVSVTPTVLKTSFLCQQMPALKMFFAAKKVFQEKSDTARG